MDSAEPPISLRLICCSCGSEMELTFRDSVPKEAKDGMALCQCGVLLYEWNEVDSATANLIKKGDSPIPCDDNIDGLPGTSG